jgi:hypothetical protein
MNETAGRTTTLTADEALNIAAKGNRDLVTWAEIRDMAETIAQQAEALAAEQAKVARVILVRQAMGFAAEAWANDDPHLSDRLQRFSDDIAEALDDQPGHPCRFSTGGKPPCANSRDCRCLADQPE